MATRASPGVVKAVSPNAATRTYSIGNPTDEEQLYLEYINRSRADPPAEGVRLANASDGDVLSAYNAFAVDLPLMISDFSNIPSVPPLSMNEKLTAAARLHSQDMFNTQKQDHNGSDGKTPLDRLQDQRYPWTAAGENIFAYAHSVYHGHAGLNVDWGTNATSKGGMQNPPGHRNAIHNPIFREIGIGVVLGSNGPVGPQLVTQDFATRQDLTPFLTGVAYYDFNGNGFYDLGEGIGGIKVSVPGSTFFAITANSGGYSVPVPADASYTVTFSASALVDTQKSVVVGSDSIKVDFIPDYLPPTVTGPDPAAINQDNSYSFTAVGGATAYQWEQTKRVPLNLNDGAENGLANLTAETSPEYEVVSTSVKASGKFSFHLAHVQPPKDQFLRLNRTVRVLVNSQLMFQTRLGSATSNQVARAQISSDNGRSWQDVWNQVGTGDRGETAFSRQQIPLGAFAGATILIRFVYEIKGGLYFVGADPGVGFYIDNISVTQAEELVDQVASDVSAGTTFHFIPTTAGDYSLRVRPKVSDRFLGYGPARLVAAQVGPPVPATFKISDTKLLSGGQIEIHFEILTGTAGSFRLESALSPLGPWTVEPSASIQTVQSPAKFRAVTATGGVEQRYYRISEN